MFRLQSRDTLGRDDSYKKKRTRFGLFNRQARRVIPAAKALHRTMNEAVAAGDLATLRSVVHEPLFDLLSRTIQSRQHQKSPTRTTWELVRYHRPLTLPKVVFHRIAEMPADYGTTMRNGRIAPRYAQEVAVVAVDSTQRLTRTDARTRVVVEDKDERRRENLVMTRVIDTKDYDCDEWKLWGSKDWMGLEELLGVKAGIDAVTKLEVDKQMEDMRIRRRRS
jgi:hypothetical protein